MSNKKSIKWFVYPPLQTYHCQTPRKLSASRMDPSCTIGFLCSSLKEFHGLRTDAEKVLAPPLQKGVYPFFSFSELSMEEMLDASVNMRLGSLTDEHLLFPDPDPQVRRGDPASQRRREQRRGRRSDSLDGLMFCDDEDFVVVECVKHDSLELEIESVGTPVDENHQFSWVNVNESLIPGAENMTLSAGGDQVTGVDETSSLEAEDQNFTLSSEDATVSDAIVSSADSDRQQVVQCHVEDFP